jgi:hypothetical protein
MQHLIVGKLEELMSQTTDKKIEEIAERFNKGYELR